MVVHTHPFPKQFNIIVNKASQRSINSPKPYLGRDSIEILTYNTYAKFTAHNCYKIYLSMILL